jgi:uncharacterized membrane protein
MNRLTKGQKLLLSLVAVLGFALTVFISLVLIGRVFPYDSIEFGNWAMWVGAMAAAFAAIGTVGTLIYIISDSKYKARFELSKIAFDEYKESINAIISVLKDNQLSKNQKWLVIESTYYRILEIYSGITEVTHINRAKSNYHSLLPYLDNFYYHLDQHDFLALPQDLKLKYSLKQNNHSVSAASEILATSWIKHLAGKTDFYKITGWQSYENGNVLKKNFILVLIAFLCSKSATPLCIVKLRKDFDELRQENYLDQWDLFTYTEIVEKYSLLFAHLLLCETYQAEKYCFNGKKSVPVPLLYVLEPNKSWIVVGNCTIAYPKSFSPYVMKRPVIKFNSSVNLQL